MKKFLIAFFVILVCVLSLSLLQKARAVSPAMMPVLTDDCTQWCAAVEPDCPAMSCLAPATLNTACKQAACQLYKSGCMACDTASCNSCLDEQSRHDQKMQELSDYAHHMADVCVSRGAEWGQGYVNDCLAYWSNWYETQKANENAVHAAALLQLGITNTTCKESALSTYLGTDCCVEQH